VLRAEKQEMIENLRGVFSDVESVVVASVEGLNADQVSGLRRKLHDAGVQFQVVKNTLAKIAAQDSEIKVLGDDFVGSTAIAWSKTDAVLPAKVLMKFKSEFEHFKVRSGFNAGKRLDMNAVKALSELPNLEELRAQFLGLVQAVPARLLAQINAPASNIVGVIQAKADKDQEVSA